MDGRVNVLRVVACFMVIQLHVSAEVYVRWGQPHWWAGNVYDSLTRACVPLFFMLAGATLLRRDEPIGVFFGKRAVRILPPLLFWSAFYLWWLWRNGAVPGDLTLLHLVVAGPTMFHLWYFYALVGVYLTVPVLRKFYLHSTSRERLWFLATWVAAASLVPTARDFVAGSTCAGGLPTGTLESVYHLEYFLGYPGYLVLGAVLADRSWGRRLSATLFVAAAGLTMAASVWASQRANAPCEYFFVYLSPLVIVAAAALFSFVFSGPAFQSPGWLATVADCTLGIYGLHVFMIDPLFRGRGWSANAGNPWLSAPLVAAGVFAACLVVVYMLRLARPVRRFI